MIDQKSSIVLFDIIHKSATPITLSEAIAAMQDKNKIPWIHCDLNDEAFYTELKKSITIPPTLTELLSERSSISKLEEIDESLTIKLQAPLDPPKGKSSRQEFTTIIIHLTNQYCLTFSHKNIPALHEFTVEYDKALRYAKTPCFILFLILDIILNEYAQILYTYESLSDTLDFTSRLSHKHHYQEVMKAKKEMIRTKRFISSIRDMLMRISGRRMSVISEQCRKYLLDLYGHAQAIVRETDTVREILNGILAQIDNSIMHKMSETMTVLTAYATIFMPPTLIASMYGMNFINMPELHWKYGYYFALAIMLCSALFLYYMFKRRRWF